VACDSAGRCFVFGGGVDENATSVSKDLFAVDGDAVVQLIEVKCRGLRVRVQTAPGSAKCISTEEKRQLHDHHIKLNCLGDRRRR
jgi:hypothetical protein